MGLFFMPVVKQNLAPPPHAPPSGALCAPMPWPQKHRALGPTRVHSFFVSALRYTTYTPVAIASCAACAQKQRRRRGLGGWGAHFNNNNEGEQQVVPPFFQSASSL